MTISILALGTRGATPLFALKAIEIIRSAGFEVNLISSDALGFKKNIKYGLLADISKITGFMFKRKKVLKIIQSLDEKNTEIVIFLFPHPLDFALKNRLMKSQKKIKFIRIVHDVHRHSGDFWPNSAWHRKSREVDVIVTLSDFVSNQIHKQDTQIFIGAHPSFPIICPPELTSSSQQIFEFSYDLIIGRHKRYQNLNGAIRFWIQNNLLDQSSILIVAGSCNFIIRLCYKQNAKIKFINKDISDETFQILVRHAKIVYCIYKKASQSGVVAMCQSINTPVVVSPVGALPEQIKKYGGGILAPKLSDDDETKHYKGEISKPHLMDQDFSLAISAAITFCKDI